MFFIRTSCFEGLSIEDVFTILHKFYGKDVNFIEVAKIGSIAVFFFKLIHFHPTTAATFIKPLGNWVGRLGRK
jgi:hypothetical protein